VKIKEKESLKLAESFSIRLELLVGFEKLEDVLKLLVGLCEVLSISKRISKPNLP
jgi:hypothetical protein